MHKCQGCNSEIDDDIAWCSLICKKRASAPKRKFGKSEYYAEFVVPVSVIASSIGEARRLVGKLTKTLKSKKMVVTDYGDLAKILNQSVRVTQVKAVRRVLADELAEKANGSDV